MIENFKKSYTDLGFPVYENPSPGNKKGGITTLEEKSLGCIEKAGHTPVVDVLMYGEVQKGESAIYTHVAPLSWISFPFRSPQSTEYSSLCYSAGSHWLSVLYVASIVHIC